MTQLKQAVETAHKITPFLWFDDKAEEAVNFYVSIFENAKILSISRYPPESPGEEGSVMTATFEIEGQRLVALNGGPHFQFTPAVSFMIDCESQEEVDRFWDQLSEDGETSQCGWLKDKYGLSWQVIPSILGELLQDDNDEKSGNVMKAMLQMEKIDIKALQQAYDEG